MPSTSREDTYHTLIRTAQKDFYVNKLSENKHDFKRAFKIVNKLLFGNEEVSLPPCEDKDTS